MTTPIYTTNYRKNLTLYWRQYYPDWTIPEGYHVHHIKPQAIFQDKSDPRINHPRNLIALHPDDHQSIHQLRGDKISRTGMIIIKNRKLSQATKDKISKGNKGKVRTSAFRKAVSDSKKGIPRSDNVKAKISESNRGQTRSLETREKMSVAKLGSKNPHSDATKKKMSEASKGKSKSNAHRKAISAAKQGVKRGPYKKKHS